MKLPKIAIENHQFTIIMVLLFLLVGIVSFITMPRSEDPQVSPPGSSVIVIYPGASPEDMERLVVDPIEEAINELENIHKFNTTIEDGLATIAVEFTSDSDPEEKYGDVLQKVNKVRNSLPKEIMAIETVKWSVSDVVVLQLALVSDSASYDELDKKADILKKKFERVSGVKKVKVLAVPEKEVQVLVDLEKIAQYKIPLNQVIGVLQSNNMNIPGGSIDLDTKKYNVVTSGAYESIDQIRNTVIHARFGKPIYLKDIATVKFTQKEKNYYARFNGEKAVYITLTQKLRTNIFDVVGKAHDIMDSYEKSLPDYISLKTVFDQTRSVAKRLNVFFSNLSGGMILVGLVIFFAFGFRTSLLIALVIPLSIVIAIGFVDLSGYGLEQMSIVAMVIALGLLVDNAIVVVENIIRFLRMGYSALDAAVEGVTQVGWAVVSSTVTTVLAFIPIVLMPGITGDFIRSMPITVVYILLASLMIALTLTPYLSKKYLRFEPNKKEAPLFSFLSHFIDKYYKSLLEKALQNRKTVLITATVVLLLSFMLFPFVGVSFFPKAEKNQFLININLPKGTNLDKTNELTASVENILKEKNSSKMYAAIIGRGNPRLYYNVNERRESSHFAQIFTEFKNYDMDELELFVQALRDTFSTYPRARIEVKEFEQGPPVEAPIAIKILGENLDILKKVAHDVEDIVAAQHGTININNPLSTAATDLHVDINRDKAAILGLNLANIDQTVRAAITGISVTKYRDQSGDEHDLTVRMPFNDKVKFSDLQKIYFTNDKGLHIPLRQIAKIEFKESPALINHFKTQRNVSVTADVLGSYSVDAITSEIIQALDKYNWPDGYSYYIGGELESREESFGGMGQALIIAIIAIFGVLVLQFRSFSQPFIVLSALPLAIIGSILALFITGYSFSFTAFVGITSLVGIVINNSIILIDYTNQLRRNGTEIIEAIKESGYTRFIPIILTTATTIGGLLPLTVGGGSLWAPMGWAIIGGLTVSTMLTLLVVPVLYSILSPKI